MQWCDGHTTTASPTLMSLPPTGMRKSVSVPPLKGLRHKVFLACKTEKRDKEGAAEALCQSLKRLQTDHFDLYQLHALKTREDVEKAFVPDGAMAAILEAKEKGLVRFVGFSAHSEEVALMALERYPFDTVMLPVNFICLLKNGFGEGCWRKRRRRERQ